MEFRKSMGMTAAPTAFPTKITRKEPLSKKALEEEWAFYKEYKTKIPTNAPTHRGKLLKEFDEMTHTASPTKSPTAFAVQPTPLHTTVTSVPTFKPTVFPTPRPTSSPTQIWVAPAIPHFSQHCDAVKLVGLHAGTKFQVTDAKMYFLSEIIIFSFGLPTPSSLPLSNRRHLVPWAFTTRSCSRVRVARLST
jgi:hypothetical protein